jgi:hypothetical protein
LNFCRNPKSKVINKIKEPPDTSADLKFVCLLFNGLRKTKAKMAGTITKETKREGQGKVKRRTTCKNKKRERASPSHDGKLSHSWPIMSLTCKSWDLIVMGGLE